MLIADKMGIFSSTYPEQAKQTLPIIEIAESAEVEGRTSARATAGSEMEGMEFVKERGARGQWMIWRVWWDIKAADA